MTSAKGYVRDPRQQLKFYTMKPKGHRVDWIVTKKGRLMSKKELLLVTISFIVTMIRNCLHILVT